jgi:hypothetical protein
MHLAELNIGKVFGRLSCFATLLLTEQAAANSYFIQLYEGEWRTEGQICSGFKKSDPHVNFGYDGEEFVSFGKTRCLVDTNWLENKDVKIEFKNPKKCKRDGFPMEYIGQFYVPEVKDKAIYGHLLLVKDDGTEVEFNDCAVHK